MEPSRPARRPLLPLLAPLLLLLLLLTPSAGGALQERGGRGGRSGLGPGQRCHVTTGASGDNDDAAGPHPQRAARAGLRGSPSVDVDGLEPGPAAELPRPAAGGQRQQQQQWESGWRGPRCLGAGGRPVDWWALLKYPSGQAAALLQSDALPPPPTSPGDRSGGDGDGGGDGDDGGGDAACWWRTGVDVNDPDGPLRCTLAAAAAAAMATTADAVGYAFYNDADPEGAEHWGAAHAKGLLLFGPSGGVWMTHSFPSFPAHPPRPTTVTMDASSDPWDVVRHAQTVYGQHALCLTLPRKDLLRVVEALLVMQAFVYDHVLPYELLDAYGAVQDLIDASTATEAAAGLVAEVIGGGGGGGGDAAGRRDGGGLWRRLMSVTRRPALPSSPPPPPPPRLPRRNVSQQLLTTREGSDWLHVAKSPNLTVPYHEEVLEPLLRAGMAWETWRVGASYDSKCSPETPYDTLNVRRVVVLECPDGGALAAAASVADAAHPADAATKYGIIKGDGVVDVGVSEGGGNGSGDVIGWDSRKDHSKWGISTASLMGAVDGRQRGLGQAPHRQSTHVCLGDLNRQPSQRFRGGGYVCSADPRVWRAFRGLVAELEPCPEAASSSSS